MKLLTDAEADVYISKAKEWFDKSDMAVLFKTVKGACVMAVAEYMANQDGNTIVVPR